MISGINRDDAIRDEDDICRWGDEGPVNENRWSSGMTMSEFLERCWWA